jgi:hypothetical protein
VVQVAKEADSEQSESRSGQGREAESARMDAYIQVGRHGPVTYTARAKGRERMAV